MNLANLRSSTVDSILPSLEEIYYCITNNLVTEKETVLYKVLLDYYECTEEREKLLALLCPAALHFYNKINNN